MNPRAEKILKQLRELPMTDVQDVLNKLKYAEEWICYDAEHVRAGGTQAIHAVLSCVKEEGSPVQLEKKNERWHISIFNKSIGTAPDLRTAQDMAESELELLGYYFPWRRGRA